MGIKSALNFIAVTLSRTIDDTLIVTTIDRTVSIVSIMNDIDFLCIRELFEFDAQLAIIIPDNYNDRTCAAPYRKRPCIK